ncbi:hypothetical protein AURDEDRAFT_111689, partial [Auricularia subglabra TFB-10046 SS5]
MHACESDELTRSKMPPQSLPRPAQLLPDSARSDKPGLLSAPFQAAFRNPQSGKRAHRSLTRRDVLATQPASTSPAAHRVLTTPIRTQRPAVHVQKALRHPIARASSSMHRSRNLSQRSLHGSRLDAAIAAHAMADTQDERRALKIRRLRWALETARLTNAFDVLDATRIMRRPACALAGDLQNDLGAKVAMIG